MGLLHCLFEVIREGEPPGLYTGAETFVESWLEEIRRPALQLGELLLVDFDSYDIATDGGHAGSYDSANISAADDGNPGVSFCVHPIPPVVPTWPSNG